MSRILTILSALLIDLTLGDPPNRFHPVVLMGNWLTKGRQIAPPRHRFWFGVGWIITGVTLFALPFKTWRWVVNNCNSAHTTKKKRMFHTLASAILLKPVFAYRNLRRNVAQVAEALTVDDVFQARYLVGQHLVSRDTAHLTAQEVAGAAIESLAENITDSLTAPLTAYAIGGLPAAWAYRFINTADAMWGYRTAEFEQLGKFPALLDDVLNWLPARLTAWLLVSAAWLAGENANQAKQTMLDQHHQTSSPNAGWTMSAMAGAIEVTLNKHESYNLVGGQAQAGATTIYRALRVADICVCLNIIVIGIGSILIGNGRKK